MILRKVLIFIFVFPSICLGQDINAIDSLNQLLLKSIPDTVRYNAFIHLAGEHLAASPELALKYADSAYVFAVSINHDNGIAEGAGWLAYLYEQKGDIKNALAYYDVSLKIFEKLKRKREIATCLNNIAAIYKDQGKIEEAFKYNLQCLKLRQEIKDSSGLATSYNNIGLIFSSQGRIKEALDYFLPALRIYEKMNDAEGISTVLTNIAFIYKSQQEYDEAFAYLRRALMVVRKANQQYSMGYVLNSLGGVFDEINQPDSALYYYREALKVRSAIDDKQGVSYSLKNIANIYLKTGRPQEAKQSLELSLQGFEEIGDQWGLASVTNILGGYYLETGNLDQAQKYLLQSLQLAKQLGYPNDIRNAAGNLQKLYRLKNDWRQALVMNDLYISMRDSVKNDENRKASIKTQFQYEYEKREAALKSEQEKKNVLSAAEIRKQRLIRNIVIGGLMVVLLFSAIIFRQRNKISNEKKRSDELLLNILPSETAEELKATGMARAKDYQEVTVLFTDFKNFTAISEKLSAQELVNEINFCYSAFDEIVTRYGLEKIKTIGDSYMCASGLPNENPDHAINAVKAALEMCSFIKQEKEKRATTNAPFFEVRIGLNSGPVVAGVVGIKKFAYDIWGDTVNIASRIESAGETGKVNISESTYHLVKAQFNCQYRGKIQAKNKGEIDMYFVS